MQEKFKRCSVCTYFDRYYIRQVKRFDKTEFGWCFKIGEITECKHCCDKFAHRQPKKIDEGLLKFYLSDLLTEISQLRTTVEAELNENEEL